MANYNHLTYVLSGTNAGSGVTAVAVTFNQAQDFAGTGVTPFAPLQIWANLDLVTNFDTLTNYPVISGTFTLTGTVSKNFQYIVEVDAQELISGYSTLQIVLANAAAQTLTVEVYGIGARVGYSVTHFPTFLS